MLLTVIVPTFNAAAFIEPLLKSFVSQNFSGAELLIIDGMLSDVTLAMVDILGEYL